jgi:ABC-type sugar transport system substrate-binding protein
VKQIGKIIAAGGLVLSAWAGTAEAKEIKIGVVNLSLCCAYFVGMDAAIKDEGKAFPNVKVLSTDAKGDVAKLTSNVEDILAQKVDGIIVSGAWIEAAPEALDAIAAVVIGGGLLGGGGGTATGVLGGVLALAVVDNVLNLFNVDSYYQQLLKGLIILVAVLARRKKA